MNRRNRARRSQRAAQEAELRTAALVVALFFAIGLLVVGGLVGGTRLYSALRPEGPAGPPRAVIVDQLSLSAPNPAFAQNTSATLRQAGYEVDYYPGEAVTVSFYRSLPELDYDLIVLRAHAGRYSDGRRLTDDVSLFTGEPYSDRRYQAEQLDGRLKIALLTESPPEPEGGGYARYFGVTADFVESSMRGSFSDATVILMGCDVLRGKTLAEAFIDKGADAVVGWDREVSAEHTDLATERLLEHLVIDRLPAQEAAVRTMNEVGPDPAYRSVLVSYPP